MDGSESGKLAGPPPHRKPRQSHASLLLEDQVAANPQYLGPDPPRLQPVQSRPRAKAVEREFPWPLAMALLFAFLLASIAFLSGSNSHSSVASKQSAPPAEGKVTITRLQVTPAPGSALFLDGVLQNAGNEGITDVQVAASFYDAHGQIVDTQTRPVQAVISNSAMATQNLSESPIAPGAAHAIRIYFPHYPASWNGQTPKIAVTHVSGNEAAEIHD